MKKVGFVSLVGRPNVGKSTLLNQLLNTKLAITSDKAGTTRNIIQGIYNDEESQIIFVDTPGIHKPINKLGNLLNKKAYQTTEGVDVILFLIDGAKGFGRGDQFIFEKIKKENIPIFLLVNKIDIMEKEKLMKELLQVADSSFSEIIPISAKSGKNKEELIRCVKQYLPEQEIIYDEEELTNVSLRFFLAEIVREKVLRLTKEEIPHAVSCYVERFVEEEQLISVQVLIVVDRDNLKKILIGRQGSMLKKIGSEARKDMEEYFGKKVYLSTYVKTLKNWRDQEKYLKELGLEENE